MQMRDNITISVITPVYNAELYLEETIRSVLDQSFADFEYLLIDHASTDKSLAIMQRYQGQDNRIRIIRLSENKGGPAYPRNAGIKAAISEFIAFVDADDVWKKDKLQRQVDCFQADPKLDMVYSRADIIDEHGNIIGTSKPQLLKTILSTFMEDRTAVFYANFININTFMIRSEQVGLFREETQFIAIEDWMFHILNFQSGKKAKGLDENLILYRIHISSLSNRKSDISYRKIFYMYSTLLLDAKIPLLHFIFANALNTCKLLKRNLNNWRRH